MRNKYVDSGLVSGSCCGYDPNDPMPTHMPHASHPVVCVHPRCMQDGNTALLYARRLDVAKLLLQHGANADHQNKVTREGVPVVSDLVAV